MPIYLEKEELDLNKSDIDLWMHNRVTQLFIKRLVYRFDPYTSLQGAESGTYVDRYKGHAEVLHYLLNPRDILDIDDEE